MKQKCILTSFALEVPAQMLEVAGDLCRVPAYFEKPAVYMYITDFPDHLPTVGHDNSWFNSKDICQQKLMRRSKI